MPTNHFLNNDGLSHVWSKLKSYFVPKTQLWVDDITSVSSFSIDNCLRYIDANKPSDNFKFNLKFIINTNFYLLSGDYISSNTSSTEENGAFIKYKYTSKGSFTVHEDTAYMYTMQGSAVREIRYFDNSQFDTNLIVDGGITADGLIDLLSDSNSKSHILLEGTDNEITLRSNQNSSGTRSNRIAGWKNGSTKSSGDGYLEIALKETGDLVGDDISLIQMGFGGTSSRNAWCGMYTYSLTSNDVVASVVTQSNNSGYVEIGGNKLNLNVNSVSLKSNPIIKIETYTVNPLSIPANSQVIFKDGFVTNPSGYRALCLGRTYYNGTSLIMAVLDTTEDNRFRIFLRNVTSSNFNNLKVEIDVVFINKDFL